MTTKVAVLPSNATLEVSCRFEPVITTSVPTGPLVGENDAIVGDPVGVTEKSAVLVAEPLPFVTRMRPVVADAGTVAVIWPFELTTKLAFDPLNVTDTAPLKFVPVIVTFVPEGPLVGENVVIVGDPAGVTVKSSALVAVPVAVITEIRPVVAPGGTTAVMRDGESTVKLVVGTPLNLTVVVLSKFVPKITTAVPAGPVMGLKEVTVGSVLNVTLKSLRLVPVPTPFVTVIRPVVASAGTIVVIWVGAVTK